MRIARRPIAWLVFLAVLLTGCVSLAPPYDKAVADGLTAANTEVMTLLASMSEGTTAATYSSRDERYNTTIGRLDALNLLASGRPMPSNKVTEVVNKLLAKRGRTTEPLSEDDSTPPSAHAIGKISESLAKVRAVDRKQGLTGAEVKLLKGQVTVYFDQAITYENFLQR